MRFSSVTVLSAALFFAGCNCAPPQPTRACTGDDQCGSVDRCVEGVCRPSCEHTTDCEDSCEGASAAEGNHCVNGACVPGCDRCTGVSCTTPPAPTCADATTVRTHYSPGTCDDGLCWYQPLTVPCGARQVCSNGRCVDPTRDGGTGGGGGSSTGGGTGATGGGTAATGGGTGSTGGGTANTGGGTGSTGGGTANTGGGTAGTGGGGNEFCASDQHEEDGGCEFNMRTVACELPPANAVPNIATSVTQTWSNGMWSPPTRPAFGANASTTECLFSCAAGAQWTGSSCYVPTTRCVIRTGGTTNATMDWYWVEADGGLGTLREVCPDPSRGISCSDRDGCCHPAGVSINGRCTPYRMQGETCFATPHCIKPLECNGNNVCVPP